MRNFPPRVTSKSGAPSHFTNITTGVVAPCHWRYCALLLVDAAAEDAMEEESVLGRAPAADEKQMAECWPAPVNKRASKLVCVYVCVCVCV